jgi:hypothetical protein
MSLMKQQFAVTYTYAVLHEREKLYRFLEDQQLSTSCVLGKSKKQFFCRYNILTEGVFVTMLSSNAGISVGRTGWIMTNCCFMSDVLMHRRKIRNKNRPTFK